MYLKIVIDMQKALKVFIAVLFMMKKNMNFLNPK